MNSFAKLLDEEIRSTVFLSLCQDLGLLPSHELKSGLPNKQQSQMIFQVHANMDVTANLVAQDEHSIAQVICKEDCIFVGKQWVEETFELLSNDIHITWFTEDGQTHKAGDTLFKIEGNTKVILTGERTALNFVQTLSATATTVNFYADILKDSQTQILDTRKTLPMLRYGQKYAVKCGGGENHRIGLYDRFLIKENHIIGCGSITSAVKSAKQKGLKIPVEVEVENLQELQEAIAAQADIVMLDNFEIETVREAVAMTKDTAIGPRRVKLEVSGNIDASHLKQLAQTGVDYVSSGAITKHVQAIDLSLRLDS